MKGWLASAACLLAFAGPAVAADYADPLPRHERGGGGFACTMSKADYEKIQMLHWALDQPCMWIGPLYVGMPRPDVEKLLGAPEQSVTANGRENIIYIVHRDDAAHITAYVVVAFASDNTTDTIQLTGQPWVDAWRFSGLTLGDLKKRQTNQKARRADHVHPC